MLPGWMWAQPLPGCCAGLAAESICLCAAVGGHPLLVGSTAGDNPGQALL